MAVEKVDSFHLVLVYHLSVIRHAHSGKMPKTTRLATKPYLFVLLVGSVFSQIDYSQYVNPLIGSEGPIPGLGMCPKGEFHRDV